MAGPVSSAWRNNVRHIQPLEPVAAANAGRPDRDLEGNTRYLRERLDAITAGATIIASKVPIAPDVAVGRAVYINSTTQRFENGLARVEQDPVTRTLSPAASCDIDGVVCYKHSNDLADVLLGGYYELDLSEAVEGTIEPGRYYLSGTRAGFLTKQKPAASVSVLSYDGTSVVVKPQLRNFIEDHIHFKIDLACRPAGTHTPPAPGGVHAITSPNVSATGWLPASHASFGGKAPTGAAFGYNLAAHPALNRIFPPQPPGNAQIIWDKGVDHVGGTMAPMGLNGVCEIDQHGIWWMSNAYGDVPWPVDYSSASPPSSVGPNSGTPENPRDEEMRVQLAFVEMAYLTDRSVVTSIDVDSDSGLIVTDCDGDPAKSGALKLRMDLNFLVPTAEASEAPGGQVLKNLSSSLFERGWVTEGIAVENSPNVTIVSDHQEIRNEGTVDEFVLHQGVVKLSINTDPVERLLHPNLIDMQDTVEQTLHNINYIGFPQGRLTSVRAQFQVPTVGIPTGAKMVFRVWLLSRANGSLPAMPLTYRRLARPGILPAALPTVSDEVILAFDSEQSVPLDHYVEVESDEFAVAPGDIVYCTLLRNFGDGYVGEVGMIKLTGIILGAEQPASSIGG